MIKNYDEDDDDKEDDDNDIDVHKIDLCFLDEGILLF